MHTSEYDYLFKLLLIGDSGVGKVRRYLAPSLTRTLISSFLRPLVLSPPAFCGRHIYGELHQYHWSGL